MCAQVLSLLLASCEGEEECRSVVAECMGPLALLNPPQVWPPASCLAAGLSLSAQLLDTC